MELAKNKKELEGFNKFLKGCTDAERDRVFKRLAARNGYVVGTMVTHITSGAPKEVKSLQDHVYERYNGTRLVGYQYYINMGQSNGIKIFDFTVGWAEIISISKPETQVRGFIGKGFKFSIGDRFCYHDKPQFIYTVVDINKGYDSMQITCNGKFSGTILNSPEGKSRIVEKITNTKTEKDGENKCNKEGKQGDVIKIRSKSIKIRRGQIFRGEKVENRRQARSIKGQYQGYETRG